MATSTAEAVGAVESAVMVKRRLAAGVVMIAIGAAWAMAGEAATTGPSRRPVTVIGRITCPPVTESSGIVGSRKYPGIFWTHNDSDNEPVLYAITLDGKCAGEFPIAAENDDWEDIAMDEQGRLYIGDIGDNAGKKKQMVIYRIAEPAPGVAAGGGRRRPIQPDAVWRLEYPGGIAFDCEALFVYRGNGYLINKSITGSKAALYRFPLRETNRPVALEVVTTLPIRSPVTSADISVDGKRLAVLTVTGLNVFQIDGDIASAGRAPVRYTRMLHPRMEACCFVAEGVLATAETREIFLFTDQPAAAEPPQDLPKPLHLPLRELKTAPRVDGDLGEWNLGRQALPLQAAHRVETPQPAAHLWAGWRKEGIYVAGKVPADGLGPLVQPWFLGDTVEIFVGRQEADRPADYENGDERCYLGFGRNADGSCGKLELHWPRREDRPPAGAAAAGRINGDQTYCFEAFIPAEVLAMRELTGEAHLRLNVSVMTHRPRRNWFLCSSNAAGGWISPLKWATIQLAPAED